MGYNAASPYIGLPRVGLPSETIQDVSERAGFGARPQTSEQELLNAVASGASSAGAQAAAFAVLARRLGPTVARNVFANLAQQPAVQTAAGAGAAAAPTALREYAEVTDPYALLASSLVGAVLGGKVAAGTGNVARGAVDTARMASTPTSAELRATAQQAYRQAENAGVSFTPASVDKLNTDIAQILRREGFDAKLHPNVSAAIDRFRETGLPGSGGAAAAPVTFEEMDILRRVARQAISASQKPAERRLGQMMVAEVDKFALNPPSGAVAAGDQATAAAAIQEARRSWARMSKSNDIEDLVENARLSAQGSGGRMDEALRTQFASLARDIKAGRHPGFTADEVANIERIAKGESMRFGTRTVSALAPSSSLRGMATIAGQAGGMALAASNPYAAAYAIPTMGLGLGARAGRNAMAQFDAARLGAGVRRGDVTAPFEVRTLNLMSPTVQQMLLNSE